MARMTGETPEKQWGGAVTRRKPESLRKKNLYYNNFCSSSVLNLRLRECAKKYIWALVHSALKKVTKFCPVTRDSSLGWFRRA